jgi:uncharacterized protein
MRIELASLEGTKSEFAHTYEPGELVLVDERIRLVQPPTVSGRILRKDQKLKVEGHIEAEVEVECDRCLKRVQVPFTSDFTFEYLTAGDYQAQQAAELSEEDLALSVFDGEAIDIDDIVREELLLDVPSHVICQEECKGLCPACGVDRNQVDCKCGTSETDPRWDALKNLQF